jgi:hypothetical protein
MHHTHPMRWCSGTMLLAALLAGCSLCCSVVSMCVCVCGAVLETRGGADRAGISRTRQQRSWHLQLQSVREGRVPGTYRSCALVVHFIIADRRCSSRSLRSSAHDAVATPPSRVLAPPCALLFTLFVSSILSLFLLPALPTAATFEGCGTGSGVPASVALMSAAASSRDVVHAQWTVLHAHQPPSSPNVPLGRSSHSVRRRRRRR